MKAYIGLIGLGVMGRNLALNIADHGFEVAVFNRTPSRTAAFLSAEAAGRSIRGTSSTAELLSVVGSPRRIVLMVQAGPAVDGLLDGLLPRLDPGDVIIDGGNSLHSDTERRAASLDGTGILYVGAGISGGEDGARWGPSIMPGGNPAAWPLIKDMLQSIAAKADGEPCCEWVGPGGAGHYVKMVHNGIEYGDMQLIAEAYHIMKAGLGMTHGEMAAEFTKWGAGRLDSFLIDLTAAILLTADDDGSPLLEAVLDAAGQKGTGKWAVISSMEEGMPLSLIAAAVYARNLSALKDDRKAAAAGLGTPATVLDGDRSETLADLHDALYAAKIISYAQGFMLLREASLVHSWDLELGTVASLWRAGCIIRSVFLGSITSAYRAQPDLANLAFAPFFGDALREAQGGWRRTVARVVAAGIPIPAMAAALTFWDGYRSERLPANLIQAQRDAFGSHTYERIDRPRGEFFHSDWGPQ